MEPFSRPPPIRTDDSVNCSVHRPEANRPSETLSTKPPTGCNDASSRQAAIIGRGRVAKPRGLLVHAHLTNPPLSPVCIHCRCSACGMSLLELRQP